MKHKWYKEIIALAEGKKLQSRFACGSTFSDWVDDDNPVFNDDSIEVRVKPEPLIAYVNTIIRDGTEFVHSVHPNLRGASIAADPSRNTIVINRIAVKIVINRIAVKMIEVEDERE